MRFRLIYADPPWQYADRNANGQRGACFKYDVMPLADILALPVADLADEDCLLVMWWTGPLPGEALATVKAWGFTLKNMAGFTWHKLSRTGRCDHFGSGHWTRSNTENVLLATKGHPRRACNSVRGMITAPVAEHSAKPAEARRRLELLMGDVPRVELFARIATPGWMALGRSIDGRDLRESLTSLASA